MIQVHTIISWLKKILPKGPLISVKIESFTINNYMNRDNSPEAPHHTFSIGWPILVATITVMVAFFFLWDSPSAQVHQTAFVFPDSSSRFLTEDDVMGLSNAEIQDAINEIYARHGLPLKKYYSCDWYHQRDVSATDVVKDFNVYEKSNVDFLATLRDR